LVSVSAAAAGRAEVAEEEREAAGAAGEETLYPTVTAESAEENRCMVQSGESQSERERPPSVVLWGGADTSDMAEGEAEGCCSRGGSGLAESEGGGGERRGECSTNRMGPVTQSTCRRSRARATEWKEGR
jgi:hypothetical protein